MSLPSVHYGEVRLLPSGGAGWGPFYPLAGQPVIATACGEVGLVSRDWAAVDCPTCKAKLEEATDGS